MSEGGDQSQLMSDRQRLKDILRRTQAQTGESQPIRQKADLDIDLSTGHDFSDTEKEHSDGDDYEHDETGDRDHSIDSDERSDEEALSEIDQVSAISQYTIPKLDPTGHHAQATQMQFAVEENTAPEGVQSEEQDHVGGSTNTFKRLIEAVILKNEYEVDPTVASFPKLKSMEVQSAPSHLRLPPSSYAKETLVNHKAHLERLMVKNPDKKSFLRPPKTLERTAEVGDPLIYNEKGGKQTVTVQKDVPLPPPGFYDLLKQPKGGVPLARAKFGPTETKALELANIWATKACNYMDHLSQSHTALLSDLVVQVNALAEWSKSGLPVSVEVPQIIAKVAASINEVQAISAETKPLFQGVVDTLIYNTGMMQLARRDDLIQFLSHAVDQPTCRSLRTSTFDNKLLFSTEVCNKALDQVKEAKKNRTLFPRSNKSGFSGKNFRSGNGARKRYNSAFKDKFTSGRNPGNRRQNVRQTDRHEDKSDNTRSNRGPAGRGRGKGKKEWNKSD